MNKKYGLSQGFPVRPWPDTSQVLPIPGGRDSGRLGLSVRTWLAEAAIAAELKGGVWGGDPPRKKKHILVLCCLNLGELSFNRISVSHAQLVDGGHSFSLDCDRSGNVILELCIMARLVA